MLTKQSVKSSAATERKHVAFMECYQMSARKTHVGRHIDNFSDPPGNRFFTFCPRSLKGTVASV
jgi:hypothetical protein